MKETAAAFHKSKMGGCCCERAAYFYRVKRKKKEKHNQLAIVGKKSIIGAPLLAKPLFKRYIKGTGSHNPKILGPIYTKPQSFLSFSFSSLYLHIQQHKRQCPDSRLPLPLCRRRLYQLPIIMHLRHLFLLHLHLSMLPHLVEIKILMQWLVSHQHYSKLSHE